MPSFAKAGDQRKTTLKNPLLNKAPSIPVRTAGSAGRHDGFLRRSYHSPGQNKAPVMAARKQTATKPTSATIEDISTQISLSAHRLTRDHNDCRAGTPSLATIAVRECTIEIHGIAFGQQRVLAVNVHGKLTTDQIDDLC